LRLRQELWVVSVTVRPERIKTLLPEDGDVPAATQEEPFHVLHVDAVLQLPDAVEPKSPTPYWALALLKKARKRTRKKSVFRFSI
jgi:hypothetical protein